MKFPPLFVLLLHLGACDSALQWSAGREIDPAALAACPEPEWRRWMAAALKVSVGASWEEWSDAAKAALLGYGSGSGYGSGYGYGDVVARSEPKP